MSKGGNPYERYLTKEDHLQHRLIVMLAYMFPKLKFHHSPDAGRRSPFERFKYKYLGSDAGFPDLIFPELLLVIELKVKPNVPSSSQKEWLAFFKSLGWDSLICYDENDAVEIIRKKIALINLKK